MFLTIHPANLHPRQLGIIIDCLLAGGIIIYPTDTVYGIGCSVNNLAAIEKICHIKNVDPAKAQLSFVCNNLSHLAQYSKSIANPTYRLLKHYLPGPYTFILPASKLVPKLIQTKQKTVGIRVPNHPLPLKIVELLGVPILSASLPSNALDVASSSDPAIIYSLYQNRVDMVLDAGVGGLIPSTVIDCSVEPAQLLRQGLGVWNE